MKSRSANQSLKGYYYQFDKTILSLLTSPLTTSITVEGIEDLDIENIIDTTVIQCKYYASKNFSLVALRPAIIFMIENFLKSGRDLQYRIYAHFSDLESKTFKPSIEEIRGLLTFTEDGKLINFLTANKISDDDLKSFLSKFTIEVGENFEKQQQQTLDKIGEAMNAKSTEEKEFFYSKALKIIYDLAIRKELEKRKISKKNFLEVLSNGQVFLFDQWFYQFKSKQSYIKFVRKSIKTADGMRTQKSKFLLIGANILNSQTAKLNIEHFIKNLIESHFKIGSALSNTECWTIILEMDISEIKSVKERLIKQNLKFNEGWEHIYFSANIFDEKPVLRLSKSDKILNSSYSFRLLSLDTYLKYKDILAKPHCVFNFTKNNLDIIFKDAQKFFIEAKNLEEVSQIII